VGAPVVAFTAAAIVARRVFLRTVRREGVVEGTTHEPRHSSEQEPANYEVFPKTDFEPPSRRSVHQSSPTRNLIEEKF